MDDLNKKLLSGYFFHKEYLKELQGEKFNNYAYGQAINNLSTSLCFHLSTLSILLLKTICRLFAVNLSQAIVFIILSLVFIITITLANRFFANKYPIEAIVPECNHLSDKDKKTAKKFSSLFFVLNISVFILVEIPIVFLF